MPLSFTNRAAALRYLSPLAALCLFLTPAAQAATGDCSFPNPSLPCRLNGLLHWLDAAAVVLVIVLLAVIVIAIYLYRKNRADRTEPR